MLFFLKFSIIFSVVLILNGFVEIKTQSFKNRLKKIANKNLGMLKVFLVVILVFMRIFVLNACLITQKISQQILLLEIRFKKINSTKDNFINRNSARNFKCKKESSDKNYILILKLMFLFKTIYQQHKLKIKKTKIL